MSEVAENSDYIELVERLSAIQSKIALGKDLKGYGYSYRNAEQILQAVKPLQDEYKVAVTCSDTLVIERCPENGIIPVGYLIATAVVRYRTAEISVQGFALFDEHLKKDGKNSSMSREQIVGCASSYARKYALQGLLAISDGADDPDGLQNDTAAAEKTAANNSEKVYNRALSVLKNCGTVSAMLAKKAEMTAKMPDYKADIDRAYDKAVQDLDALNEENQAAANSHNDDCHF